MRLSDVKKGWFFSIRSLPPGKIRIQAIRLGFSPGAKALCLSRFKKGPVVFLLAGQEIACGRKLAEKIMVIRLSENVQNREEKR